MQRPRRPRALRDASIAAPGGSPAGLRSCARRSRGRGIDECPAARVDDHDARSRVSRILRAKRAYGGDVRSSAAAGLDPRRARRARTRRARRCSRARGARCARARCPAGSPARAARSRRARCRSRRGAASCSTQAEADAAHGLDPAGVAEFAAQRGHVHVDRLRRKVVARVPHVVEQALARDDRAGPGRQRRQEIELLGRQLDLVSAAGGPGAPSVSTVSAPTRSVPRRRAALARAPRDGVDAARAARGSRTA